MRPLALTLIPLWLAPITACGQSGEQAETQPAADRTVGAQPAGGDGALGTIRATVDGEQRTWYVVQGSSRGRPYASAIWFEDGDVRLVSVGGYDTDSPPLDTFEFDTASGEVSFGDYQGSGMQILVSVSEGSSTVRVEIPSEPGLFWVGYIPVASFDVIYGMTTGSIEVTEASFDGSQASVRGTFSGTLEKSDGSGSIQVENGSFEASGIPHRDDLIQD